MHLKEILKQNIDKLTIPLTSTGLPAEPARLLFGRGNHIPGWDFLNIDIFPPLIFITLYETCSNEKVEDLVNQLQELFPGCPIWVQDRSVRPATLRFRSGDIPQEMVINQGDLQFYIHPGRGQNPGFFTDMREGRRVVHRLITHMKEKNDQVSVLNLFAYTCAFSVISLAAGAKKVVNIDMNKRSLDIGRKNHRLNQQNIPGERECQTLFLPHNIFKSWGKLKKEGPYDLIIVDPPPSQKGSFDMYKDYPRLLRRLPDMLTSRGQLLLSLNNPGLGWEDLKSLITENLPDFNRLEQIAPPADFAPSEDGRGLKLILAKKG